MPYFNYHNIKVAGVAAAVPVQRVGVGSFTEKFGEAAVSKFSDMTGVLEFRKTRPHQTASDLGYAAAEKLFSEKNMDRDAIGALVFVAHSTDYRRPATACVLHKRLGLSKECAAFDVGLGCSAAAYGIQAVCSMMASSDIERALLITAESMTKLVNPQDRSAAMLFGDGGAAVLLEKGGGEKEEIRALLRSDGSGYRTIIAPAGGFRNPDAPTEDLVWPDGNIRSLYNSYMNGTDVFTFALTDVAKTVREFFARSETTPNDYDCFAFHQANRYIHRQFSKKLKIPSEKMPLCMDRFGNTSAPSPLLALCDAYGHQESRILKTLFCCFGVGLSWGVLSANISADDIYPILETDAIFEEGIINAPF